MVISESYFLIVKRLLQGSRKTDVPADGVEEKDIELVMQQAACTRAEAISAL